MIKQQEINELLEQVESLEQSMLGAEEDHRCLLKKFKEKRFISVKNLLHYLALRTYDLRPLQKRLALLAISSFGHSGAYTLHNLQKVKGILKALSGKEYIEDVYDLPDKTESEQILNKNASRLLGEQTYEGQARIMVTLPKEAAFDFPFVKRLIKNGMSIARINTAYDDQYIWEQMIKNCTSAAQTLGKPLKIYMDLVGPRVRVAKIKTANPSLTKKGNVAIFLQKGQLLKIIYNDLDDYKDETPAIVLSLPQVFNYIEKGEKVWFDEGRLGGTVRLKDNDSIFVEITDAPTKGFKLKEGKGVNLPESKLDIPALTAKDIRNLPFIAKNADMIGYSFVKTDEDVRALQETLNQLGFSEIGVILKIETQKAFENLPSLLFQVMQSDNAGIMVARGDLAVELGILRMAEVQEEILWFSEAAHLPVIWASQILETYVRKGMATRAEISDVVKATSSECVMLNKGPFVGDAIKIVENIDRRMYTHQEKEHRMLRALHVAQSFFNK